MDVQGTHFHHEQCYVTHFTRVECFLNAGMLASGQTGTGMNKNADAGTSPVLE
jgi:hypothetical protein